MKEHYFKLKIIVMAMLANAGLSSITTAQDCYSSSGCSDYSNFGYNSTTASDLEYDNYVSGFHQTVVRDIDGSFKVWGEKSKADGVNSWLTPTPINAGNYPGLTGTPLKAGIGSGGINIVQFILLTDDNKFWVWGVEGVLVDTSLTTGTSFQELPIGLPTGLSATDVKMLFTTSGVIALTTCEGDVYVLSRNYSSIRGNGGSGSSTTWARVEKEGGGFLTNVVATRGTPAGLIALDTEGHLWSWGIYSWNGTTARVSKSRAVQVTLPAGATGAIKMIGATSYTNISYYILYEDGNLYTLGGNTNRELGNWTIGDQTTWVQPTYDSAGLVIMDDIVWISPNEHDSGWPNINVLSEDKKIYNWGYESGGMLGRGGSSSIALNPGEPDSFQSGYENSMIVSIETGGHTTMMLRQCEDDFGYMGHRIRGSMGDNTSAENYDNVVHFNTNAVHVCGAEVLDARLNASLEGPYYVTSSITLMGEPAGGHYYLDSTSTATIILEDSTVTFTGAGTLRMNYMPPDIVGICSEVVVNRTFNVINSTSLITIPGNIWDDGDGNAVIDAGEEGLATEMWANLTDPNGIVIASVKVNADGTYQFDVSTTDVSISGDYSVILTNNYYYKGDLITVADNPASGYEYTGTNRGSTGVDVANDEGILNMGDLSTLTGGSVTDPVNFGIRLIPPVANNDMLTGQIPGTSATVPNILGNDTDPNGGILDADNITLIIPDGMPTGTTGSATDEDGDITEITVPGEGVWVLNADGSVTFTPEPTFFDNPTQIQYTVKNEAGSTSNVADIIIEYNDIASISGIIYNDANGATGGVNGVPMEGVTVTLYAEDGVTPVATTVTSADGSYNFGGLLPGDYIVSVTTPSGYGHISSTDATPTNGLTSITVSGTTDVQQVNFGMQQPPVADVKEYEVSNSAFGSTPPTGFPDISSPDDIWHVIPMSSPELTGVTGGALSGSDPEDCAGASACSNGATFTIETINSNTRLFYDFGGIGVVEINTTAGSVEIENFDVTKMIIWAQEGAGNTGNEIGFTYSIIDQAGVSSDAVSYTIETSTPLPMALVSFIATQQNGHVLLKWATAKEVNNKGFDIERSADTEGWITIGFVNTAAPSGNSTQRINYSFMDKKPLNNNFYRLKQTDFDGVYSFSIVRQVSIGVNNQVIIYPNPATNYVIIGGVEGEEIIKIYDGTGNVVRESKVVGSTATINLDGLSGGIYYVTILSKSGHVVSEKILKL